MKEIVHAGKTGLEQGSGRNKALSAKEIRGMKLGGQVWRPAPLKIEFSKLLLPMPLLFLSGVFAGIGIMLAVN